MSEIIDLKDWLKDIEKIIIDLIISIQNIERLLEEKYEFESQIKSHGFFQHHFYQLSFISIIQLCKLLSPHPNEKISFYKLCTYLELKATDQSFLDFELQLKKTPSFN